MSSKKSDDYPNKPKTASQNSHDEVKQNSKEFLHNLTSFIIECVKCTKKDKSLCGPLSFKSIHIILLKFWDGIEVDSTLDVSAELVSCADNSEKNQRYQNAKYCSFVSCHIRSLLSLQRM